MARMFPSRIPPHVSADPFRSTEIEVFKELQTQLDDEFCVFYSRPWFGLTPRGEEIDGEADFIVVHEKVGMLAIEVKGGLIEYDAESDCWSSTNRHGFKSIIKDPVYQARTCKHRIIEKMSCLKSFSLPHIRARHGVIFPHSEKPPDDLGADRPLSIFCFAEQFPKVGTWVRQRMGTATAINPPEQYLSADGIKAFIDLLAKSFQLRVPTSVEIRREEKEIEYLSTEQFWILDFLSNHKRCAVSGLAGTGKTVLAIERATRSAESGVQTALLCFNRPLADHLKAKIGTRPNLTVATFHEFVLQAMRGSGMKMPDDVTKVATEEWATFLLDATSINPLATQAFVIDEGQDFRSDWWEALENCLDDNTLLYVFYDNQQQLYQMPTAFCRLIPQAPFPLTLNIRNSKQIFKVALPWFGGAVARSVGPDGPAVLWTTAQNDSAFLRQLRDLLSRLTVTEHIPPAQITILCPSESYSQILRSSSELKSMQIQQVGSTQANRTFCSGVARFKGLESPVIILVLPDDTIPEQELLYVGLTRARSLLCLFGNAPVLNALKAKVNLKVPNLKVTV